MVGGVRAALDLVRVGSMVTRVGGEVMREVRRASLEVLLASAVAQTATRGVGWAGEAVPLVQEAGVQARAVD